MFVWIVNVLAPLDFFNNTDRLAYKQQKCIPQVQGADMVRCGLLPGSEPVPFWGVLTW